MGSLGAVFAVLLVLGTPIAVALGMAGIAGILAEGLRTVTAAAHVHLARQFRAADA